MTDFFEVDFLDVETSKSGDAICVRYQIAGTTSIHVVDSGFRDTGTKVVDHLKKYYGNPTRVDHVVVTHPDGDHAGGIPKVLEAFEIGTLWMLRPWLYADELLPRFERFTNAENLARRLKEIYPFISEVEKIALDLGIDIKEPFQGSQIGSFYVLTPTRERWLDLIVASEKSPQSVKVEEESRLRRAGQLVIEKLSIMLGDWGVEIFSSEGTSAENEMSVVQFANLCGKKILLTADSGREGLQEALDYAPAIGLELPGIDRFQVPHHGSRRNVSTALLDSWLGKRISNQTTATKFTAIFSSAKDDEDHPRKSVIRAMHHRAAFVCSTEGKTIRTSQNAPARDGWSDTKPLDYPPDQEQ